MDAKVSSHWPISLTSGLASLFNLFLPLALVRILSPEQMGHYKLFFMYIMLSPAFFLVSGLGNGLYLWSGRSPGANVELRQTWSLFVLVCVSMSVLGLAVSSFVPEGFSLTQFDVRIFLVAAPLSLASVFLEDLLVAQNKIWAGSLYGSITNAARALAVLLAAWLYREVEPVLWAFLFVNAARVAVGVLLVALTCGPRYLRPAWDSAAFKRVVAYAFPISVAGLAAIGVTNVDQLILSMTLDPANFAFYTLGCLTVPPLQSFESSVNRVAIPRMAQEFAKEKTEQAALIFRAAVGELFRYLLPATLGLMIFSRPIVELLFTGVYAEAAVYLRVYALIYVLLAFPYDVVARARGEGKWILRTMLQFMLISLLVTWAGARFGGAMGALLAFIGMQAAIRLYAFRDLRKRVFKGTSFVPVLEIAVACLFAGALSVASILLEPLFPSQRAWFLVTAPAYALIYVGGVVLVSLLRRRAFAAPVAVIELCQFAEGGGLERTAWSLTGQLAASKDFRPQFVSYDQWRPAAAAAAAAGRSAAFPVRQWHKGSGFSFSTLAKLLQLIVFEKVAIVHAHDLGPLVYGALAKILLPGRVRLVLTQHTLLQLESRKYRLFYRLFLPLADRVVAVSPAITEGMLKAGGRLDRMELIENGASFLQAPPGDEERIALRKKLAVGLGITDGEIWLLALARVHEGKGQREVLNVWAKLSPQIRQRARLFIVGPETDPAYAASLRGLAASLPEAQKIHFMGESTEPAAWLAASDVFLSGSLHEGRPLAPLEAAGSGLLTFLSEIEGHRFLKDAAILLPFSADTEAAARRISDELEALEPHARQSRHTKTASLRASSGEDAMCARYAELLRNVARLHVPGTR